MNDLVTMLTVLVQLLGLGLAVGAASWTSSKALIFKRQRDWIDDRNEWLGDLVNCPYCTSHWLAGAAVIIYHPIFMNSGVYVLDLFMSGFIVVAFASFTGGLIYRAFRSAPQPTEDEQSAQIPSKSAYLIYDKAEK